MARRGAVHPQMGIKLAICGKGGLIGKVASLAFAAILAALLATLSYVVGLLLLGGAVSSAGLWAVTVAMFFLILAADVLYSFVVFPEVEVYDRGLLVKTLRRRLFVPWSAISVIEGPQRTRVAVKTPLTPVNRLVGTLLVQPHPVFLMKRRHHNYSIARRIMRDKLQPDGRFKAAPLPGR